MSSSDEEGLAGVPLMGNRDDPNNPGTSDKHNWSTDSESDTKKQRTSEPPAKKRKEKKPQKHYNKKTLPFFVKSLINSVKIPNEDSISAEGKAALKVIENAVKVSDCYDCQIPFGTLLPGANNYRGLDERTDDLVFAQSVETPANEDIVGTDKPPEFFFTGPVYLDAFTTTGEEIIERASSWTFDKKDRISGSPDEAKLEFVYLDAAEDPAILEVVKKEHEYFESIGSKISQEHCAEARARKFLPVCRQVYPGRSERSDQQLRELMACSSICVIEGIASACDIDLNQFTGLRQAELVPDTRLQVRRQLAQAMDTNFGYHLIPTNQSGTEFRTYSYDQMTPWSEFYQHQQKIMQIAIHAREEIAKRPHDVRIIEKDVRAKLREVVPEIEMDGQLHKPSTYLPCFGTNHEINGEEAFEPVRAEVAKFPSPLLPNGKETLMRFSAIMSGINEPQIYSKAPLVSTAGHTETNNVVSLNLNIGPASCTWLSVPMEYLGQLQKCIRSNGCPVNRKEYTERYGVVPYVRELLRRGIPVQKFEQKAGDTVLVGVGTYHWVFSNGFADNISWNICIPTYNQFASAMIMHDHHMAIGTASKLPIEVILWNMLKEKDFKVEPKLKKLIKMKLMKSLAVCKFQLDYVLKNKWQLVPVRNTTFIADYECCCECYKVLFNFIPRYYNPSERAYETRCFKHLPTKERTSRKTIIYYRNGLEKLSQYYDSIKIPSEDDVEDPNVNQHVPLVDEYVPEDVEEEGDTIRVFFDEEVGDESELDLEYDQPELDLDYDPAHDGFEHNDPLIEQDFDEFDPRHEEPEYNEDNVEDGDVDMEDFPVHGRFELEDQYESEQEDAVGGNGLADVDEHGKARKNVKRRGGKKGDAKFSLSKILESSQQWHAENSIVSQHISDKGDEDEEESLVEMTEKHKEKNCFQCELPLSTSLLTDDDYRGITSCMDDLVLSAPDDTNHGSPPDLILTSSLCLSFSTKGEKVVEVAETRGHDGVYMQLNSKLAENLFNNAMKKKSSDDQKFMCNNGSDESKKTCKTAEEKQYVPVPVFDVEDISDATQKRIFEIMNSSSACVFRKVHQTAGIDLDSFSLSELANRFPQENVNVIYQLPQPTDSNFNIHPKKNKNHKSQWPQFSENVETTMEIFSKRIIAVSESGHKTLLAILEGDAVEEVLKNHQSEIEKSVIPTQGKKKAHLTCSVNDFDISSKTTEAFKEFEKFPDVFKPNGNVDLMRFSNDIVKGINTPVCEFMSFGSRRTAQMAANGVGTINMNQGPGTIINFCVPWEYYPNLLKLAANKKVKLNGCGIWPNMDQIMQANIPVMKFEQKPGELAWIGMGTLHWAQCNGTTSSVSWNIAVQSYTQMACAAIIHDLNLLEKTESLSLFPIEEISWNMIIKSVEMDSKMKKMVKSVTMRSLAKCQSELDYVNKKGWAIHNAEQEHSQLQRCQVASCRQELFSLVPKSKTAKATFCLKCIHKHTKKRGNQNEVYVIYQRHKMEELVKLFDTLVVSK